MLYLFCSVVLLFSLSPSTEYVIHSAYTRLLDLLVLMNIH